ncbi:hypothetical protein ACIQUS_01090 [Pseudomonas sp. NPDC090755]|uniref:hypothetical protein n=1 Tax=Pseudomonas sp. NPDC090755 TaxID=3364481 RepID=UPI00383A6962
MTSDFFHSWHPGLSFAFLFTPFVIGMSGVAISCHIACSRNFSIMLAALPNCPWLLQQIPIWGVTSLKSRYYLVNTICAAMLYPPFGIRRGLLNADEVRNFPPGLKRRMVISAWLVIIGSAWLFLGVGLITLLEA